VRNRDIRSWRSIVVLGGDGIFFEIINGIFEREDWQQIIDEVKVNAKTSYHLNEILFSKENLIDLICNRIDH
jgi:Diacylglycerol kinase catalytic domain